MIIDAEIFLTFCKENTRKEFKLKLLQSNNFYLQILLKYTKVNIYKYIRQINANQRQIFVSRAV